MDDLILSMIVGYGKYGDILGFNKSDIDNFINKYNYLENINCNERGYILLWKNKYINNEQFGKYMEIEFKDDKIYLVTDDFSDILGKDYDTEISILNGESDSYTGNIYDNDVSNYWNDYDEDTIKSIYDYCIKNELEIEGEVITKENTKIENGDIFFNDESLSNYIDDEDGLSELKDELNFAICEAQESADIDEIYQKVKNAFIDEVGEYKWIGDKLYIELDKNIIDEVEEYLVDTYGEFDFDTEDFGFMLPILKDMEKFDFRTPNYDHIYGTIDNDVLNELTINRLN